MLNSFLNLNTSLAAQFQNPWLFLTLLWVLPWTPPTHHPGVALWKAAKNGHKKWFIALLLLNTLAILEIIYIFVFSKPKQKTDVESH